MVGLELDQRRVTVDRQMQVYGGRRVLTTPKAEKVRTITVPGLVAVELRRHVRDHQADGILLRGLRGAEMLPRDQFALRRGGWRSRPRGWQRIGSGSTPAATGARRRCSPRAPRLRQSPAISATRCASTLLAEGAPITAVAGHLGDTVETVSRTYVHWLRDDRDVPAAVLDRVLAPPDAPLARHDAAGADT